jgi:hypothetical protein
MPSAVRARQSATWRRIAAANANAKLRQRSAKDRIRGLKELCRWYLREFDPDTIV